MAKTSLKADTKNGWFYIHCILVTLLAFQRVGHLLDVLSQKASTYNIVMAAVETGIFVLFAISAFFLATKNLKKTIFPAALVCLYMSANIYGLFPLLRKLVEGGDTISSIIHSPLTVIFKIAISVGYIVLMLVYILKGYGKFSTRRPLLLTCLAVLILTEVYLVLVRFSNGSTPINAIFTIDLMDDLLCVPISFTALTLSLRR